MGWDGMGWNDLMIFGGLGSDISVFYQCRYSSLDTLCKISISFSRWLISSSFFFVMSSLSIKRQAGFETRIKFLFICVYI